MKLTNPLELADKIASFIMTERYPDGWMVNEIPGDERSTLRPNPELEEEYGDLYVDAEEMIEECSIPIDDEQLNADLETMYYALVAYVEDSAGRNTPEAKQIDKAWKRIKSLLPK